MDAIGCIAKKRKQVALQLTRHLHQHTPTHNSMECLYCHAFLLVATIVKFEHVIPILRSLHWLPIRARIQFKVLTLVFKCLHGNAPAYLSELIKQYQPSRNLRSQSKNLLCEIRVKSKTFGDRAFEKMAPKLWNNLPQNIRSITDFDKFKSMLKTHLLLVI